MQQVLLILGFYTFCSTIETGMILGNDNAKNGMKIYTTMVPHTSVIAKNCCDGTDQLDKCPCSFLFWIPYISVKWGWYH